MEALGSTAKPMIKGLSTEEEEPTAYGDISYKSQQERNTIQLFTPENKKSVLRAR